MGLTSSPRIFTKNLKPVFAYLRARAHISTAYIDDSCLLGLTYWECANSIKDTVSLMDELGLIVSEEKSVLLPCTRIEFLGFILCSESMTVRLNQKRCQNVLDICNQLKNKKRTAIGFFAKVIRKLVASEPGVEYAMLNIKPLEVVKDTELKIHKGNCDGFMKIPSIVCTTLEWWLENLSTCFKKTSHGKPHLILYSYSSNLGWGGGLISAEMNTTFMCKYF